MQIRDADITHVAAITEIYNDAVAHSTAIWNESLVGIDDRTRWHAERVDAGYPVLVAVDDSDVLGYATYGPWRPHSGYRHTVEHSVYVRATQRGRGIGGALMRELLRRARESGVHAMVGAVDSSNRESIVLHTRLGFVQVGRLPQVGAKFGRWLDLTLLQLILDERPLPDPIQPA